MIIIYTKILRNLQTFSWTFFHQLWPSFTCSIRKYPRIIILILLGIKLFNPLQKPVRKGVITSNNREENWDSERWRDLPKVISWRHILHPQEERRKQRTGHCVFHLSGKALFWVFIYLVLSVCPLFLYQRDKCTVLSKTGYCLPSQPHEHYKGLVTDTGPRASFINHSSYSGKDLSWLGISEN